jgi:hypothetical protein
LLKAQAISLAGITATCPTMPGKNRFEGKSKDSKTEILH